METSSGEGCQPACAINGSRDSRTEMSSSTMKTAGLPVPPAMRVMPTMGSAFGVKRNRRYVHFYPLQFDRQGLALRSWRTEC